MTGFEITLIIMIAIQLFLNLILFDKDNELENRIVNIERDIYVDMHGFRPRRLQCKELIKNLEERIDNIPQVKAEKKLEKLKEIEQQIINLQEEEWN